MEENIESFHVFLKEDIPDRYHWKRNSRITEIVLFGKILNVIQKVR